MVARVSLLQLARLIKCHPLAALIQHSESAMESSSLSVAVHSTAR
jgi:hypothetical protein